MDSIVDLIVNNKKAEALDKINDLIGATADTALNQYKEIVASSFFDEVDDDTEE